MKLALLDTDILSEYFKGNTKVIANIAEYLKQYESLNLSIITYYEILNGLYYKDAKNQLLRFEEFVMSNNVIPLSLKSVQISAKIQSELRKNGEVIGHTDTLIAGVALANNMQLISNNISHFKRIKNLELDNWV